jgi:hypothetical protein
VLLGKGVESSDGIPESTCGADVFPCQGGQTRFNDCQPLILAIPNTSYGWSKASLLQSGVIGVLTGLTRTLSRCS